MAELSGGANAFLITIIDIDSEQKSSTGTRTEALPIGHRAKGERDAQGI
jgi:hypothetical protein